MTHPILADAGVPMIFLEWPLMLCALVPIIAIEALVMRKRLALSYRKAFGGAAAANLASTAAGVPLAWITMLVLEFAVMLPVGLAAYKWNWPANSPLMYLVSPMAIAWVAPPVKSYAFVAFAATMLLVPTFFVSVRLERRVCRRFYPDIDREKLDRAVWYANLCSYAILLLAGCGWWGHELCCGGEKAPAMRRMSEHPVDLVYLHDAAIHGCNEASRAKFVDATAELEANLADLQVMMHDVETGKIGVWKNLNRGSWDSERETRDSSTRIHYYGPGGQIESIRKDSNKGSHPFIYDFRFNEVGYMTHAEMPKSDFYFDDKGRLRHWHGEKVDCWCHPGE